MVLLKLMTKLKSLVSKKKSKKQLLLVLKCSVNNLTKVIAGDNVGVLLRGIQRDEIERGQVFAKPGSINPHTKFKGEVYILI